MKITRKTLPLATLVEDFSLYPRNHVDEGHVNDLVRALQSGAELPPIIVCAVTLRIADGVHRCRAIIKKFGNNATALVELRKYDTDAALFMDAVALNSSHGRKLDRHDQTRIVLRLRELQIDDLSIALALHVPEPTIQALSVRVVYDSAGLAVPSKRGLEHLRGRQLSVDQLSTLTSVRSAEAGRLCLELTRLLDSSMVDLSNEQIVERLRVLAKAIESALVEVAA